jgi:two-component system, cell cycle sensor histidine kinase and response regulator CckA
MKMRSLQPILRIVLPYGVFASLWILLSDRLLESLITDPAARVQWSIYKGWTFVLVTALLLAFLLRFELAARERVEDALRESEARMRLIGDNLPDSYVYQFIRNADGSIRFLHMSAGVASVHGVSAQTAMRDANALLQQNDPEALSAMPAMEDASRKTMSDFAMELRFQRTDGQWRWLHISSRPRLKPSGQVVWDGVATDVTARRQAEETIKHERDFSAAVLNSLPGVLNCYDEDLKFLHWNKNFERVTGYSSAEISRMTQPDFSLVAERESLMLRIRVLFERGGKSEMEASLVSKNGAVTPYYFTGIRAEIDGQRCMVAVGIDISWRKQAEVALRESEERLRAMAAAIMDALIMMNGQGRIYFFNAAAEKMFGYPIAEISGQKVLQLLTATPPRNDDETAFAQFVATGRGKAIGKTLELMALRKGGEEFPVEMSLSAVRVGEEWHAVGVVRDITERKRMEEQLRQALKMESVGQLAGGVAHDFNNILAIILMQLSLLRQDPVLPTKLLEPLLELEHEARRAANLTRQLLLYSRRQVMQIKALELNGLIDNLLKMLGRLLGEQIQLSFHAFTGPVYVEADPGMLEQVVMNLCVNARDAMPKGGYLDISVAVKQLDASQAQANIEARPGNFVCLQVADTGCGMDDATRKKIFDPFFTTKEIGKGTGLGLATAYGIIKQHQGWIEVKSTVGGGTTFTLFLPAAIHETEPKTVAETTSGVTGGSETILLVEDDAILRHTVAYFLRQQGYHIIEAANGVEALRLWTQHQQTIEMLLTDMVMPEGMTGLDLASRLRAQKPALKVIVSSGYSADLLDQNGRLLEGVYYLPKPCEAPVLAKTIRACFDSANQS